MREMEDLSAEERLALIREYSERPYSQYMREHHMICVWNQYDDSLNRDKHIEVFFPDFILPTLKRADELKITQYISEEKLFDKYPQVLQYMNHMGLRYYFVHETATHWRYCPMGNMLLDASKNAKFWPFKAYGDNGKLARLVPDYHFEFIVEKPQLYKKLTNKIWRG